MVAIPHWAKGLRGKNVVNYYYKDSLTLFNQTLNTDKACM